MAPSCVLAHSGYSPLSPQRNQQHHDISHHHQDCCCTVRHAATDTHARPYTTPPCTSHTRPCLTAWLAPSTPGLGAEDKPSGIYW